MINILLVTYSIMAAIIGAGFASGQEILLYFVSFGKYGVLGIGVTVLFSGLFVYAVLNACRRQKITSYDSFLMLFKSHRIRNGIKAITLLFAFAVYGAMLSASGEIMYELFGISKAAGALLCTICSAILFITANEKVFTINGIPGICLVIAIVISALYMLSYREYHTFSPQYIKTTGSGFIYSGYNLISLTPVLVALSKKLRAKTDCTAVSVCVTVVSAVIMMLIFGLLAIYANKINLGELPMLTLAKRQSTNFALFYSAVLATAIITTLISSGGALCSALKMRQNPLYTAILASGAYLFSGLGFSTLVDTAYRICGIAGFIACIAVIFVCISAAEKK